MGSAVMEASGQAIIMPYIKKALGSVRASDGHSEHVGSCGYVSVV